jgi:hypothetical protein
MVTVLTESGETQVSADAGSVLWMSAGEVEKATGWQMKPEGFCKGDICVPTPAGQAEDYVRDDNVNVSAFWNLMGKPAAASQPGDAWVLGEGAEARNDALLSLEAPNFTLPDFNGKLHSLTDFRRKRVLLITWASW